jgi:hypothetical protein
MKQDILDNTKTSSTPVSDSIFKQLIGFEEWIINNYKKYHNGTKRFKKENTLPMESSVIL